MSRCKKKTKPKAVEHHLQQISRTRSFPRFDNHHPMIEKFVAFLRGLDDILGIQGMILQYQGKTFQSTGNL